MNGPNSYTAKLLADLSEPRQGIHEDGTEELKTWEQLWEQCQAAAKVIKELQSDGPGMPQWVSVADRMPENDTFVLVCNGKWTGVGLYIADEAIESERWQDEHREFIEHLGPKVTHWMPLPGIPATPMPSKEQA